jgi:quercetin dioxygenase-like cupin family protein
MTMTRPVSIDARLRRAQTQGAVAVVESSVAPDTRGPALHVLPSLDESFYMLEGKLTFQVGDVLLTALPGGSVFAPHGTPHTYANQSDEAARVLVVCTPTGRDGVTHRCDIVGPELRG